MFRRFVSTLSSAAIAAGLVSTAVLASPASATNTPPPPDITNPSIQGCGIPVTLVLDASGSIDDTEAAQMRSAATAFTNGLADTGSTARIVEFATTSKQLIERKNIAGAGLTQLLAAIASYKSGGLGSTTNWESPLWRTSDEPIPGNKGLVVFMTDGDPNTIGDVNGSGTSGATDTAATAAAKVYSDQLKTDGNRMLAVGIGTTNDGQKGRLKQISGPNLVTSIGATDTINDFDAVVTNSFDDLTAAMKRVAASLCGGSITIRKYSDFADPNDYEPVEDWPFSARVTPGTVPTDFEWVQPAGETTNTASLTTDPNGFAQFQYAPKNTTTRTVRVSEPLMDTYYPQYAECTYKGIDPPADTWDWLTEDGDKAYFEVTLKSDESVSCKVYNMRGYAELKLVKQVEGADPDNWTLTAKADEPNDDRNISTPGGSGDFETVYAGAEYTLGETGPDNYSQSGDWVCTAEPRESVKLTEEDTPVNVGDKLTLHPYDRVTCTIVNVRDTAELKLVKQVSGANPNDWTLSAKAAAPDDGKNFSNPGGSGDFTTVYAGTQYTLSETGPAGYTGGAWVCEGREVVPQVVQSGDKVTLSKNEQVTCTIVNTRDTGSLTISKEFNPQDSGFNGTFDIAYACVEGATPVKSGTVTLAAGGSQTITGVPSGAVCTVSEPALPAAPTGWSFNPPTFSPANGQATIGNGTAVTVRVINSVSQVSPVVVKRTCPIDPTLMKPKPKRSGNHILIKRIKTRTASCALVKPVVLCKPIASSAAGETAFCDVSSRRSGRVKVDTDGYDAVRVTVVVRAKPKPGFKDTWKPRTWRKSWVLR